jgi:hypothetical protein
VASPVLVVTPLLRKAAESLQRLFELTCPVNCALIECSRAGLLDSSLTLAAVRLADAYMNLLRESALPSIVRLCVFHCIYGSY